MSYMTSVRRLYQKKRGLRTLKTDSATLPRHFWRIGISFLLRVGLPRRQLCMSRVLGVIMELI